MFGNACFITSRSLWGLSHLFGATTSASTFSLNFSATVISPLFSALMLEESLSLTQWPHNLVSVLYFSFQVWFTLRSDATKCPYCCFKFYFSMLPRAHAPTFLFPILQEGLYSLHFQLQHFFYSALKSEVQTRIRYWNLFETTALLWLLYHSTRSWWLTLARTLKHAGICLTCRHGETVEQA